MNKWISITLLMAITHFMPSALAQTNFQQNNILISSDNYVHEYEPNGTFIQKVKIPQVAPNEYARDLAVSVSGHVAVFNGTFTPKLSIYNGKRWSGFEIEGWSTINHVSYGGIAAFGNDIYLTDLMTANGGEARGIIEIDFNKVAAKRFFEDSDFSDITLGQDGMLYALKQPSGLIEVINPLTSDVLQTVALDRSTSSSGITANKDGEIFIASSNGYIAHFDVEGQFIKSLHIGTNLTDIDLDDAGRIIVGSRFGSIFVTDESFSSYNEISVTDSITYVSFASPTAPFGELEPPVLTGSHKTGVRKVMTTLSWTPVSSAVNVFLNDRKVEKVIGTLSKTYTYSRKIPQVFKVCMFGTNKCSEEYIAN